MRLYKITSLDVGGADEEKRQVAGWETSDSAASKLCTALKKADKTCDPKREEVELLTNRTALVAFLNEYAAPGRLSVL